MRLHGALLCLMGCSFDASGGAAARPGGGPIAPSPDAGVPAGALLMGSGQLLRGDTIDLTAEGHTDWAQWGLLAATDLNHKAGVARQIGDVHLVGAVTLRNFTNAQALLFDPAFTWSDGAPTSALTAAQRCGLYVGGSGNGFAVDVAASPELRTLRVYVGAYYAKGKLVAHLSDGSAPDYVDNSLGAPNAQFAAVYTLVFRTPASGVTLHLEWTQAQGTGDVNWSAASLQ